MSRYNCSLSKSLLIDAVRRYLRSTYCDCIALSGGIDTSFIAYVASLEHMHMKGIVVFYKGGIPRDLPYSIYVSRKLGIDLHLVTIDDEYIRSKASLIVDCTGINDYIEVRNDLVFLRVLEEASRLGCRCIYTGDGGDELFAGYGFTRGLLSKEVRESFIKLGVRGRYPGLELAECINVEAHAPLLSDEVIEIIMNTDPNCIRGWRLEGKHILRELLEEAGIYAVASRRKTPAEQGGGTDMLCKEELERITGLRLTRIYI